MTDPVFFRFRRSGPLSLGDVLAGSDATVAAAADLNIRIHGLAAVEDAAPGALTLAATARDLASLSQTAATACFVRAVDAAKVPAGTIALVTEAPERAFLRAAAILAPDAFRPASVFAGPGVSPGVALHPAARLEPDVVVDPGAVIGARAEIGSGTVVGANCIVGPDVRIGRDCVLGAGATLVAALLGNRVTLGAGVRIGGADRVSDKDVRGEAPRRLHLGRVILQDDVTVDANTTIGRGILRDTVVGEGTTVGPLAALGADAYVGRHCRIAAQGRVVAGASLEDFAVLATAGTRIEGGESNDG